MSSSSPAAAARAISRTSRAPQGTPLVKNVEDRFTAPEKAMLWPQAKLHTQWPGTGVAGDPSFDQFFASQVPFVREPKLIQTLNRDAAVALLDKIGPAIVMTHSQSGAYGWPIARSAAESGEGAGAGRAVGAAGA